MSQETLEIVRGIAQAAAGSYDGGVRHNGEPLDIGLKRELGNPLVNSRTMDSFKVRVQGNVLIVTYVTETTLPDAVANGFENDIEGYLEQIVKFLKSEYKKITKKTLSLTDPSECEINVEKISQRWVTATCVKTYKIGGIPDSLFDSEAEPIVEMPPEKLFEQRLKKYNVI